MWYMEISIYDRFLNTTCMNFTQVSLASIPVLWIYTSFMVYCFLSSVALVNNKFPLYRQYGRGDHGRLGYGRKVTTGHPMEVPIDLPPPENSSSPDGQWWAKLVACGGRHTLAIAKWTEVSEAND
jgi:hypothetical protein